MSRYGILIALAILSFAAVFSRSCAAPAHRQVARAANQLFVTSRQAMLSARRLELAMTRAVDKQLEGLESLHAAANSLEIEKAIAALQRCVSLACDESEQEGLVMRIKGLWAERTGLARENLAAIRSDGRIRDYELFGILAFGALVLFAFFLFPEGEKESLVEHGEISGDDDESALEETLRARLEQLYQVRKRSRENARFAAFGEVAAGLSHGLKTPLACVRAAAQVAQAKLEDSHSAQKNLDDVIDEVDSLVAQINGFLRTMGGNAEQAPLEALTLPSLIEPLDERYRNGLASRGVSWAMKIDPQLDGVLGEAEMIEMALRNLIDNAFEASPKGATVTLFACACPAPERVGIDAEPPGPELAQRSWVEFAVVDEGGGIARDLALAERPKSSRADGSGLGIAIARRIAARLGGALELRSREDGVAGTRASFILPPILMAQGDPESKQHESSK